MSFIEDPSSGRRASVSSVNRVNVSAKTNPRIFYISRDDGLSFNLISDGASIAAGDICMYLKNTSSTRNLFIHHIEFHSVEAVKWKVFEVTGTPSGTAITPSNLNLGSGIPAEASAYGNGSITGLTTVKQIGTHRTEAFGEGEMVYNNALILPPNSAIAVEYDTGTTGQAEIDCFFHYEAIGAR